MSRSFVVSSSALPARAQATVVDVGPTGPLAGQKDLRKQAQHTCRRALDERKETKQTVVLSNETKRDEMSDVHDVRRDHRLVVLAALHLAEAEQVLDHRHEEALLLLLVHRARDRADRPAERVEVVPRPLASVDLRRELFFFVRLG